MIERYKKNEPSIKKIIRSAVINHVTLHVGDIYIHRYATTFSLIVTCSSSPKSTISPSLTSLISFLEVSVVETWKFAFSIIYILEDVSYFGVLQLFSIL
ncbi:hypothetical protein Leryth_010720 [Lithospermum erythrorhizon]|nr:hypothetical protein Leryth_010720 [Lithospermum erythrorhizon]